MLFWFNQQSFAPSSYSSSSSELPCGPVMHWFLLSSTLFPAISFFCSQRSAPAIFLSLTQEYSRFWAKGRKKRWILSPCTIGITPLILLQAAEAAAAATLRSSVLSFGKAFFAFYLPKNVLKMNESKTLKGIDRNFILSNTFF